MSEKTTIEWADHSWSPWEGCTKVSPGCAYCYAERENHRWGKDNWGKGKPRRLTKDWKKPFTLDAKSLNHWCSERGKGLSFTIPRRHTIFPSICDWLDDEVPVKWLERFLELIQKTPNINWLLLTKRPENFVRRLREVQRHMTVDPLDIVDRIDAWISGDRVPQNVWLGASVEDQKRADERIPALQAIPAKLRFLSVEPLLGSVDLGATRGTHNGSGLCWDWAGEPIHVPHCDYKAIGKEPPRGPQIDWVIAGGESGPRSRPCNVAWVRSIVRQCKTAGVPCFVKQLGADVVDERANSADFVPGKECWPEGAAVNGCTVILKHKKGGDPAEWPEDLRVRQFPEVKP